MKHLNIDIEILDQKYHSSEIYNKQFEKHEDFSIDLYLYCKFLASVIQSQRDKIVELRQLFEANSSRITKLQMQVEDLEKKIALHSQV